MFIVPNLITMKLKIECVTFSTHLIYPCVSHYFVVWISLKVHSLMVMRQESLDNYSITRPSLICKLGWIKQRVCDVSLIDPLLVNLVHFYFVIAILWLWCSIQTKVQWSCSCCRSRSLYSLRIGIKLGHSLLISLGMV